MILSRTVSAVISDALRSSRLIASEQPINPVDFDRGIEALNNICKFWQTKGYKIWRLARATMMLEPGKRVYDLPDYPCGDYEQTLYTNLSAAAVISASVVSLDSVEGIITPPDLLDFNPTDSTSGWQTNNATLSGSLVIENDGANQGSASYTVESTPDTPYRFVFTYGGGTSGGATVSISEGSVALDSLNVTTAGTYELRGLASGYEIVFTVENDSSVNDETSEISYLNYADLYSGSRIGIETEDGARHWDWVIEIDSLDVTMAGELTVAADDDAPVVHFPEQIPRPLKIQNITYVNRLWQSEIPVTHWSRQEYFDQPDKSSKGSVVNVYYQPDLDMGKLYVWQTASNINNALFFDYREPLDTYTTVDQPLRIAEEYYMALKWAIAAEIAPIYGVKMDRQKLIEEKAFMALESAMDNDTEDTSIFFEPDLN